MDVAKLTQLVTALGRYTASHPRTLAEMARHAFRRRLPIPLDLIRWALAQIPAGGSAPTDITVTAEPPALGLGATLDVMGTQIRVDAKIFFESVDATAEQVLIAFRVQELRASVLNNLDGNLAKLLASGVLNLAKPASLLSFAGSKRPAAIVDAKDDHFVVDLMKIPNLAKNPVFQKAIAAAAPVVSIGQISTTHDLLLIGVSPVFGGLRSAIQGLRS